LAEKEIELVVVQPVAGVVGGKIDATAGRAMSTVAVREAAGGWRTLGHA